MGSNRRHATVLIVDDQTRLADAYAVRLEEQFETRVAYDGQSGLEHLDESVDVVLLDRRMPGLSGDEVLEQIRAKSIDCRIIMLTAVDPDFDIVEMPFDDYLHKPVDGDELHTAIERQLAAREYGETATEFVELTAKIQVLEEKKPDTELENAQPIEHLRQAVDDLEGSLEAPVSQLQAQ